MTATMEIPIVEKDEYQLYEIHRNPMVHQGQVAMIRETGRYLITNDRYRITMDTQNNCEKVEEFQVSVVYYSLRDFIYQCFYREIL